MCIRDRNAAAADGTLANPFTEIDLALNAAAAGDIVRVVGNAGADGDISTVADSDPCLIGYSNLDGSELADGGNIIVPQGVTLMVDANVVIKSRRGRIAVGSSTELVDRSDSTLQIFGIPRVTDAAGNVVRDENGVAQPGSVVITSLYDGDHGAEPAGEVPPNATAMPGDWGGIDIRNDFDKDREDRHLHANDGVFLTTISNAQIMYGGGSVVVDGKLEVIEPILLRDARPTVALSLIHI